MLIYTVTFSGGDFCWTDHFMKKMPFFFQSESDAQDYIDRVMALVPDKEALASYFTDDELMDLKMNGWNLRAGISEMRAYDPSVHT